MSRRLDIVEASGSDSKRAFLGTVLFSDTSTWETTVLVQGPPVKFKIDTGADESALPTTTFDLFRHQTPLSRAPRQLYGPDWKLLTAKGVARIQLAYRGRTTLPDVYVLQDVHTALLGKPAIQALRMLTFVNAIAGKASPKDEFPSLFQGLGKLPREHHIRLRERAKPFGLRSPRRIPIPLYEKMRLELRRMENIGVISAVDEPTEGCAPMVVVLKPTGDVRICMDFTELNRHVLREWHPIPSVEHTLGLLHGAKVFSKLDANSWFWQIPPGEDSKKLTTFISPFGRFSFNRLPFGKQFQKQMSAILEGVS